MITLTWKYDTQEQAPCPDYKPDPYTGAYPTVHCLVYHFRNITRELSKTFETQEQVDEFKKNAPVGCYDWKQI